MPSLCGIWPAAESSPRGPGCGRLGSRGHTARLAGRAPMSVLKDLIAAIRDESIEVIDLTAPLNESTPVIQLPEPFGNTATFALREISRYDERGPAWYWNDIRTGEHTGTHFDAPLHCVTGAD